uniref:Uncharacterized protein n=1 Tax=Oryza meridionalis TaxID=40149 RepID=A0A0E0DIK2_9ORYZ
MDLQARTEPAQDAPWFALTGTAGPPSPPAKIQAAARKRCDQIGPRLRKDKRKASLAAGPGDSGISKDSVSESGNVHSLQISDTVVATCNAVKLESYNDLESKRTRADVQYFSYPISYHAHVNQR